MRLELTSASKYHAGMLIVADMHVHLYACFDLHQAFNCAISNLNHLAGEAGKDSGTARGGAVAKFLFLTERSDCHFFRDIRSGRMLLPGMKVTRMPDESVLLIEWQEADAFYLVAGRQIVTAERLEILALGTDRDFASGLPASDTISSIAESGAIPVLNWAFGKWWFRRGRVVSELLDRVALRETLSVCDISLRPRGYPEPSLMKKARSDGFRIIAGSDPLPLPAEERLIGTYGEALSGDLNLDDPLKSFWQLLKKGSRAAEVVGRRSSVVEFVTRTLKLNLRF